MVSLKLLVGQRGVSSQIVILGKSMPIILVTTTIITMFDQMHLKVALHVITLLSCSQPTVIYLNRSSSLGAQLQELKFNGFILIAPD